MSQYNGAWILTKINEFPRKKLWMAFDVPPHFGKLYCGFSTQKFMDFVPRHDLAWFYERLEEILNKDPEKEGSSLQPSIVAIEGIDGTGFFMRGDFI